MDKRTYGVHANHCCPECGCKYDDPDCPVVNKIIEPEFACYECEEEQEHLVEALRALSPEEMTEVMRQVYEGKNR